MPSVSKAQHNLMEGVAHNPEFAAKVGIKPSVGKDFVEADKATGNFRKPNVDAMPQHVGPLHKIKSKKSKKKRK